jgi:hypothetical protein
MVSWMLLAAMLVSPRGGTVDHMVCAMGMAQAGPACPLCKGHALTPSRGPQIARRCCEFVAGEPAPVSHRALRQAEQPISASSGFVLAAASIPSAPERRLALPGGERASPRPPSSRHLSNFLRL